MFTLAVISVTAFLAGSSLSLSVLTVEEALNSEINADQIAVSGWVSVLPEDHSLCMNPQEPRGPCIWLDVERPSHSKKEAVENCRNVISWFEQFHGKKVVVGGIFVSGPAGHLGASPAELQAPHVVRVLEAPDKPVAYSGICLDVIEWFGHGDI